MSEGFFAKLLSGVKAGKRCRVVIPQAADEACAFAISRAMEDRLVSPICIGDETEIGKMYPPETKIIAQNDRERACKLAVSMIRNGEADILMKGNVSTSTILKAVLHSQDGIKKNSLLSHVSFFEIPGSPGMKLMTDAAINIAPGDDQYEQIMENSIEAYSLFGGPTPKVALLSANEKVSVKVPSTIMAKTLSDKWRHRTEAVVEGPISMDLSVSSHSARAKKYHGKIQGDADIFIVPRIETGGIFYKTFQYFVGADMAGVVFGAKCPIVLTSRSDNNNTKFFSLLLGVTLWLKQNQKTQALTP